MSLDGMRTDRAVPPVGCWACAQAAGAHIHLQEAGGTEEQVRDGSGGREAGPGVWHLAQPPNTAMAEGGKMAETGATADAEPRHCWDGTFPIRLGKKVTVGGFPMRLWGPCRTLRWDPGVGPHEKEAVLGRNSV